MTRKKTAKRATKKAPRKKRATKVHEAATLVKVLEPVDLHKLERFRLNVEWHAMRIAQTETQKDNLKREFEAATDRITRQRKTLEQSAAEASKAYQQARDAIGERYGIDMATVAYDDQSGIILMPGI